MDPIYQQRIHAGDVRYRLTRFEKTCDKPMEGPTGFAVETDEHQLVCDNQDYYPHEVEVDFMRRIVACLNHCQGMATDEIEKQNALLGLGA